MLSTSGSVWLALVAGCTELAACAWHDAVVEFGHFAASTFTAEPWHLCTFGVPAHIEEIGRWLSDQQADNAVNPSILFYAPPATVLRESLASLAAVLPDAHYVQSLEEVPRKWCRIWLLQESPPRWNIGELRHLLENQIEEDVITLAHLGRSCDHHRKSCRMLHQLWDHATAGLSSCGRHLCFGRLQPRPEELHDEWLEQMDCQAMIGKDAPASWVSQWQQDWFVYHNFFRGTILDTPMRLDAAPLRQGVFVDVGAFHPVHLSNTFFFEHCLGWRGICVEPNPDAVATFASYRPQCNLVSNCVWSSPRQVVMSYMKDPIEAYIHDSTSGGAGSGAVVIQDNTSHYPSFRSTCRTLQDILISAGLRRPAKIDFMSVDTEAAEVEVFRNFPFEEFDISVILVEVQVRNFYDLDVIFLSNGYGKVAVLGGDHVFAKLPRKPDLPVGWQAWQEALSKDFYTHAKPKTVLLQRDRWDTDAE